MSRFVRLSRIATTIMVTSLLLAAAARAASPTPDDGAFADGHWTIFLRADVSSSGSFEGGVTVTSSATVWGLGNMLVVGGDVSDGAYSYEGPGQAKLSGPGMSGTYKPTVHASGPIEGNASEVLLAGTSGVRGSATITINGVTRTVVLDEEGPNDPPAVLSIFRSSCDRVTGDWTIRHREIPSSHGLSTSGEGPFIATRLLDPSEDDDTSSTAGAATFAIFGEMVAETDAARSGDVDVPRILDLLDRAEAQVVRLEGSSGCRSSEAWFVHTLGPAMADLLTAALEHPDRLGTVDLTRLVSAAYRTGVIGSTATDAGANVLESAMQALLADRLDTARAAGDRTEAAIVGAAAAEFGWSTIADRAAAWLRSGGE